MGKIPHITKQSAFEAGQSYHVNHFRKGEFDVTIDRLEGSMLKCTIISGMARQDNNRCRFKGDKITLDTDKRFIQLSRI